MRTVLKDAREVAHSWAHQSLPKGRIGAAISFNGPTLFSYAEPIARIEGQSVLLIQRRWSITTSRHQSIAAQASNHLRRIPVIQLSRYGALGNSEHRANREWYEKQIISYLDDIANKRRARSIDYNRSALAETIEAYKEYRALFSLDWPETPGEESIRQRLADEESAAAAARDRVEYERRIEAEQRAREQAEHLAEWRVGHNPQVFFVATALRVNGEEIETTHGARIPVSDAIRVWPLLCRVKRGGGWEREPGALGTGIRLGQYRLDSFDGEILKVGCHRIPWAELAAIAEKLGLPAYEPAKEAA